MKTDNHIPTSNEKRFYVDLQLFYDENGKPCIDAIHDTDTIEHLRGVDWYELLKKLEYYLFDFYEILNDILEA